MVHDYDKKTLFFFGTGKEYPGVDVDVLGNKGYRLAADANSGLPVPPGFTISTKICHAYYARTEDRRRDFLKHYVDNLVMPALDVLASKNDGIMPLVSVRSGAPVSMPGMMETVLNVLLGTKLATLQDWRQHIGHVPAMKCYQRLLRQYIETVDGCVVSMVDTVHDNFIKEGKNTQKAWEEHLRRSRQSYEVVTGRKFPIDPHIQLVDTIDAVLRSWMSPKALEYRQMKGIPHELGTAISIVSMKFGNLNKHSGSGVYFTRSPVTGENKPFGEYLPGIQGDQVVDGVTTPHPLSAFAKYNKNLMAELIACGVNCEKRFDDMQEIEFTVEDGKLWVLQSRDGKRERQAKIRIAYEMWQEGQISLEGATERVCADDFLLLNTVTVNEESSPDPDYQGMPASTGIVTGKAVLTSEACIDAGGPVILVREMTETDDITGMAKAVGFLTATGGMTCHAAVVARDMNKPAVVGVGDLSCILEGDDITIDGSTGNVWLNTVPSYTSGQWDACTEDFYQALREDLHVMERISFDPKKLNKPQLATSQFNQPIQVDTNLITSPGEMLALLSSMDDTPGFYFLNLESYNATKMGDDEAIWNSFGVADGIKVDFYTVDMKLEAMHDFTQNHGYDLNQRVYVQTADHVEEVSDMGWKAIADMHDLVTIAKTKADVIAFTSNLCGILGADVESWKKFCEAAGKTILEPIPAKTRHQILVDIFKPNL